MIHAYDEYYLSQTMHKLGVMFELLWNNSSEEEQDIILKNIKKGM